MNPERPLPRIFHGLVNYGTQSGLLARELRKRGYDAISVTAPDNFKRLTDLELRHGGVLPVKIWRHLANYWLLFQCFCKYDIFHFYFGHTLAPRQLDLPLYRIFGKKVLMEYLGSDIQGYEQSVRKYRWTNLSQKLEPAEGRANDRRIKRRSEHEKKHVNQRLVCAPIYSEFADDAKLLPLAIDMNSISLCPMPSFDGTFRIMHAPTHRGYKGTDFILKAIDKLRIEGFSIDFDVVEGVTHEKLLERYRACHIFIDQIMAGWYGTATIEAMAIGRPVVVSIRESYFQHIDYGKQIPAINADPDCITEVLRKLLKSGYDEVVKLGLKSRQFVERVHSVERVTDQLIAIYESLISVAK